MISKGRFPARGKGGWGWSFGLRRGAVLAAAAVVAAVFGIGMEDPRSSADRQGNDRAAVTTPVTASRGATDGDPSTSEAPSGNVSRAAAKNDAVSLAALPAEAMTTYRLVRAGGPFPFAKDGSMFGNRERQLPNRQRGYYREYTVATPQSRDRGARRIVCGGAIPTAPEACYYTDDHYASFRLLAP